VSHKTAGHGNGRADALADICGYNEAVMAMTWLGVSRPDLILRKGDKHVSRV
jgi:hypothetical protein